MTGIDLRHELLTAWDALSRCSINSEPHEKTFKSKLLIFETIPQFYSLRR